ncbi:P-loop containing nucleoside triphosphate hydrolase protein [Gigaspora margarita]|uniref:P-loop containing nucleoside triphosphate hydrolase protein n=2 Tax=Gigaspora margarita TaxID=4874 RepID=A0A8H3XHS1_GIGMA|nr:P-loop containing nucleoside triphosphate hydrolase protein [Gigaspora margarita]
MPLPRSRGKDTGLGKAIIRDRFKGNSRPKDGDTALHTTDLDDGAKWTKLQSITQQSDLDEFLSTAQLAGTQFTAEKMNIKVITNTYQNPFLLSADKEKETLARHEANKERLVIPRRPKWDKTTTPEQLDRNERDAFLQWRRDLAVLQEQDNFLLTPFERNLEVWRQLWRVIERSDLVVQIVDARNPLFFRSEDLEKYVKEINEKKKCMLLINKADLLTARQRRIWADYLDSQGIRHIFFSAVLAHERLEKKQNIIAENETNSSIDEKEKENFEENPSKEKYTNIDNGISTDNLSENGDEMSEHPNVNNQEFLESHNNTDDPSDQRERICTTEDLISILVSEAKGAGELVDQDHKITIGLVGYPNVGKSFTINALLGEKRVSVSSTPGKTKHFQTIHLSPSLVLCDCPGLVFPNFATTNGDMVCNGVLPIDQLREHTGPIALIAQRIPKAILEAIYSIKIKVKPIEEGGTGIPSAEELMVAYAVSRGYTKPGHGSPDESRAARYILKDYVNGKLPYCHPPPIGISKEEFNAEIQDLKLYTKPAKKKSIIQPVSSTVNTEVASDGVTPIKGDISRELDKSFFNNQSSGARITGKYSIAGEFNRVKFYPIHATLSDDATPTNGSRLTSNMGPGKKRHWKGRKNQKQFKI